MSERLTAHVYIFSTIFFTVYSQLVMRWQVASAGELPIDLKDKIFFIIRLLFNPWIISGVGATFLAGISWMLAMTKFEISYAYPFVSLNYILVLFAGFFLFNESITLTKIVGSIVVMVGVVLIAKG